MSEADTASARRPRPRPRRRRGRPAPRRRAARAAPRPHRAAALPHRRRRTARTVRDFDVEHDQAHAPDRRPPRPDRLPAPAPRRMAADGTWSRAAAPRPTPAPTACSPTSRTTASRARSPPTCASTAPPTCGRCPRRGRRRSATAATTCALDAGAARAGDEAELRFTVTRTARRSQTEPYLGAGGHLVALREGDLAFLHVHPTRTTARIGFEADVPDRGPLPPVPAVPARRRASRPPRSPQEVSVSAMASTSSCRSPA